MTIVTTQSDASISIHAPRGGSDTAVHIVLNRINYFNPRSPWGERRAAIKSDLKILQFQSTLPVGGATPLFDAQKRDLTFQSTLPVGGATVVYIIPRFLSLYFNPRSPWGERRVVFIFVVSISLFQSTLPVGGATHSIFSLSTLFFISIHAPRGGSDI